MGIIFKQQINNTVVILTGGIGCGKSVVSQILKVMGHSVYDCDREARRLMLHDPALRQQLIDAFGTETYLPDGTLNKPYLAQEIFSHPQRLVQMNALVHPAVADDILRVKAETEKQGKRLFVESAIYYESGFSHRIEADSVWCIAAPLELRIARAMARDHAPREAILARINNQMSQEEKIERADIVIWNDNEHSVIEQLNQQLRQQ